MLSGTYESSLINCDSPPRVPSPPPHVSSLPHVPTPSLDELILLYKKKFSEEPSSSKLFENFMFD